MSVLKTLEEYAGSNYKRTTNITCDLAGCVTSFADLNELYFHEKFVHGSDLVGRHCAKCFQLHVNVEMGKACEKNSNTRRISKYKNLSVTAIHFYMEY